MMWSEYCLLINKDICDHQNVSVKLLCVYMCLALRDLFIFSVRVSSFCVICTLVLSFPCCLIHFILPFQVFPLSFSLTHLLMAVLTSCLYWIPHVPFCPCRDANLSPIWGIRTDRTLILQNLYPSELRVNITWSTIPVSLFRRNVLASLFVNRFVVPSSWETKHHQTKHHAKCLWQWCSSHIKHYFWGKFSEVSLSHHLPWNNCCFWLDYSTHALL